MTMRDDLLNAGRRASEVINQFGVRQRIQAGYTRVDPEVIAAQAEVTVLYRALDRLLGAFVREAAGAGIIVNIDRPRGLVHMTSAHELGHYFMGHESTSDDTMEHGRNAQLVERQADNFAYSLLAPAWLVSTAMRQKRWTRSDLTSAPIVYQLSLRLGLSFTAMAWSLMRGGLLTQADAERIVAVPPKALKQAALSGTANVEGTADVWVLDASDKDRILEPSPKDRFVIDLPNHASAGHLWTIDDARSEGFHLRPFVRDASAQHRRQGPDDSIVVGGGGKTLRYSLDAAGAQAQELEGPLTLKRHFIQVREVMPWDPREARETFAFGAEFELLQDGYSRLERERRLSEAREAR